MLKSRAMWSLYGYSRCSYFKSVSAPDSGSRVTPVTCLTTLLMDNTPTRHCYLAL